MPVHERAQKDYPLRRSMAAWGSIAFACAMVVGPLTTECARLWAQLRHTPSMTASPIRGR